MADTFATMPYDHKVKGLSLDNGGEGGASSLAQLNDVQITDPQNGNTLVYDGTAEKWVNGAGGGAEVTTIYTDIMGGKGGDGYYETPYPLYSDAALTTALTKDEIAALITGGNFVIEDKSTNTQWTLSTIYPVLGITSPSGAGETYAEVIGYTFGEGVSAIHMGVYSAE